MGEDGTSPFVRHVALARGNGTSHRDNASVYQMGPPLEISGRVKVDVLATANLYEDERQRIKVFIERHAKEHLARRISKYRSYCICPHVKPELESDGTRIYTRFSCVGFVLEAYRFATIEPIELSSIPAIDILTIAKAYPEILNASQKLKTEWGLDGNGPWRVVFSGYLIHGMNRDSDAIRSEKYAPRPSDAEFP